MICKRLAISLLVTFFLVLVGCSCREGKETSFGPPLTILANGSLTYGDHIITNEAAFSKVIASHESGVVVVYSSPEVTYGRYRRVCDTIRSCGASVAGIRDGDKRKDLMAMAYDKCVCVSDSWMEEVTHQPAPLAVKITGEGQLILNDQNICDADIARVASKRARLGGMSHDRDYCVITLMPEEDLLVRRFTEIKDLIAACGGIPGVSPTNRNDSSREKQ